MKTAGWIAAAALVAIAGALISTPKNAGAGGRGLGSISVPPGFEVELAATPGLVRYPMLGTLDDRGRLFMCESSGQTVRTPEMTADPRYVVSLLEDTDGDGVYDKSTQFADRLTLPAGAAWYRGSLYVAAPPTLWRFQDTDGDGVADVKETVVTGWNLSANAASLHGPILGPDGWLYLTDGRHGFKIETKDGRRHEGRASRIWRVRPDGTGLEWVAGGGFDNPVEVAFTEAGEMIGTMTYFTDPMAGQRDALLHFVEGGVYPKPHPAMEEFQRTGDLMPVMTKFARVAPAGLMRYRGSAFGGEFHGNLFSAHFNSHLVQRHQLSRTGATFTTTDTDFFFSNDPDLHPTDVIEDADGSMLIVDTGAWFIHGCPLSRLAKPDVRGALYRVRRAGAGAVVEDPRGSRMNIASMHVDSLIALLEDKRPAVADRAVERLVELGDAAVEPLSGYRTQTRSVEAACTAVFALSRIGSAAAKLEIAAALDDARAEVRTAAARMAGMARDKTATDRLIRMALKESPPVRRQAIAALGQIADPRATAALLEAAATPEDRFVEHSIIYSLIQTGATPALVSALANASPKVRKAALIALDQTRPSPLRQQQVLGFLTGTDEDLRRAALWVASRHPDWSAGLSRAIEARLRAPAMAEGESQIVRDAMASLGAGAEMRAVIASALGDARLAVDRQLLVLEAAEQSKWTEWPAEWTSGLDKALAHATPAVRLRAIALARARGVTQADGQLRRIAARSDEPDDNRVAALSALGARNPAMDDAAFDYLVKLTGPRIEAPLKLAAAHVLGRAQWSDARLTWLARNHLRSADPLVLPALLDAFRGTKSEAVGRELVRSLEAIESTLGTVGSQRVEECVKRFPEPVHAAARPLLERIDAGRRSRLDRLRRLAPVLHARGDVVRGREIFMGAKAGCSSCHTIGSEGGNVGPDLTSIGAIRSPHDLLEAIVLPSESFVPGHEVYRVETARMVYSGVLKSRNDSDVLLITGPGDEVLIPRSEVVKMGRAPVSLMPEGFDEVLATGELTDLLAFLRAQTSRQAALEMSSRGGAQ